MHIWGHTQFRQSKPQRVAAEYRRLGDRVDVFWTGRDSTRASRTSVDPVRPADARQAVLVRSEGRCENPDCTGDIHDLDRQR